MEVASIALSPAMKTAKQGVQTARLVPEHGLEKDAHAGAWHRQVSFLAAESIERVGRSHPGIGFGAFAENIATRGIDWGQVKPGTRLQIGSAALIEITQIGKKCHGKCAIYEAVGDCIMPREGVFGRVLRGGEIAVGDSIVLLDS